MNTINLVNLCKSFGTGKYYNSLNVFVSPLEAEFIVNTYNYAKNRPLSEKNVAELRVALDRGQFREYTPINFAVLDGVPYLINGQHTLRAIASSTKGIWLSFCFQGVTDEQEIEALYSTYDIGRKRALRDVLGTLPAELSLTKTDVACFGAAVGIVHRNFRELQSIGPELRYELRDFEFRKTLMREWQAEASLFFSLTFGLANKHLFQRSEVLAVALVTLRQQPERARDFWHGAVMDNGLYIGDPRKTLIDWLRVNPTSRSLPTEQYRAAIKCWNYWFERKKVTKIHAGGSALKLLGTAIVVDGGQPRKAK